ncbi:hypothetical protein BGZ83_009449 [Gryganskiella cystojenkinii]|nr:hypothetical protein BGZ83_009449 [Gryganskiella cystojenkinii]
MTFFKLNGSSKKNKTASAANTPAATPRTSVQLNAADLAAVNKTPLLSHEEALEMLFSKNAMGHMQALSMSRIIPSSSILVSFQAQTH